MTNTYDTREAWLMAATHELRPLFKQHDYEVPSRLRCSVGFPSTGRHSDRIGECWYRTAQRG